MEIITDNYSTFKYTCRNCYSVLKVSADDLKGGDVTAFSVTCPLCNWNSQVNSNQIPKRILEQLDKR